MLIYKKMGYLAVNIGPHDVKAGVSFLQRNRLFPWISSNFYNHSGESLFSQYITKNVNGLQIGVVGVTAPPPNLEKDVEYRNWPEVLPGIINKAGDNCDFIILLSALPQDENNKIANQFPEIRLIISANLSRGNVSPQKTNNAILTQTDKRGKYLGHLTVFDAHSTTWEKDYQNEIDLQKRKINTLEWQISKLENTSEQSIEISQNISQLQTQKNLVEELVAKLEEDDRTIKESDISQSTYDSHFIALRSNIPEDKGIADEIRAIKNSIHEINTLKGKKAHSKTTVGK